MTRQVRGVAPSPTARPQRRADVEPEATPDGNVVRVDADVHVLNDTALALWELCDGRTSAAEMVDSICQLFGAPRATVEADVARTLDDLAGAGLVTWRPEWGGDRR